MHEGREPRLSREPHPRPCPIPEYWGFLRGEWKATDWEPGARGHLEPEAQPPGTHHSVEVVAMGVWLICLFLSLWIHFTAHLPPVGLGAQGQGRYCTLGYDRQRLSLSSYGPEPLH